jgi:signal transduction histidine kinase
MNPAIRWISRRGAMPRYHLARLPKLPTSRRQMFLESHHRSSMESVKIPGADSQTLRANKLTLVERLADDLAHEIKNPLHSMVINLEVLKRRVSRWSGADATELMRYVGILAGELDRVSRRIDLLLRMVRMDRGGEPVTLAETVEDLLEIVELERERLGISIDLQPPTHSSGIRIPRDSARQIVLNLLLIAIDAAAPDGAVSISSHADASEDALRILVVPGTKRDRSGSAGVAEDRTMSATVRTLADSLGGRLEVGQPATGPDTATEILVTVAADTP